MRKLIILVLMVIGISFNISQNKVLDENLENSYSLDETTFNDPDGLPVPIGLV